MSKRPTPLLLFFLFIPGFLIWQWPKDPSGMVAEQAATPNIVLLFCDDLGYGDLGVYGHPTIRTPHLDQMAATGAKLTNFYAASPACTASRYALLTGRYPGRSGFPWVLYPRSERGLHSQEVTLAEALQDAGYRTACYGKWHLGSNDPAFLPLQQGFDEYLGLPYSNDMIPPKWPAIPLLENNDTLLLNPDQSTLTKLYTERAIDFIQRPDSRPFFLYLPYAMPHLPLHPGAAFAGKSARGKYGDVVEEIDWSVGQMLAALAAAGLDKNTLVFFTSDNGPWIIKNEAGGSAGLLRDGKGSTWEGGMRVPAIAHWPGIIEAGTVFTETMSTLDLLPTLVQLAGGKIPTDRTIDGRNMLGWPLPNNTKRKQKLADQPFFYYGPHRVQAVRKGPWKLHIHTSSQTGKTYFDKKIPLLFHLEHDPSEQYDVAEQHPEIVRELQALIEQHQQQVAEEGSFFGKD